MADSLLNALNVNGWGALLFVAAGDGNLEEAPEGMSPEDPRVLRHEQWIVAGEQFVFVWREPGGPWSDPQLGEYDEEDGHAHVFDVEDLIPLAQRALSTGQTVHPVILSHLSETLA